MKKIYTTLSWLFMSAVFITSGSGTVLAADCPADIKAKTDKDAEVSLEVLTHMVKPLTRCELEA